MQIARLDHFVLTVRRLEPCLEFYAGVLGMEHRCENGRHSLIFGAQKINIHTSAGQFQPAAACPAYGSQDFCLITEQPLEAVRDALERKGWPCLAGIVARQGALGPMRSIYVRDPDGNLVEIASYRPPAATSGADPHLCRTEGGLPGRATGEGVSIAELHREARPGVTAALLEIWEASVRASHGFLSEADIARLKPQVREAVGAVGVLAVARMGDPVGFMGIEGRKLEMLFVHPAYFRRGIGALLARWAMERHGVVAVDCNAQNPAAVAFYTRMGFVVVGRSASDGMGNAFPLLHLRRG